MRDRSYLIYGVSPLMVGVANALAQSQHQVCVLYSGCPDEELLQRLPPEIQVQRASLSSALFLERLQQSECLLALDEEDQANLRTALKAHRLAPQIPVVMRTFDPSMAEALEQGVNVRRAFSLSAIAAPFFVADLLAEQLLTTLNLGGEQVSICRMIVEARSPLVGMTQAEVEAKFGCLCLAGPGESRALAAGDSLVLAGLQLEVLGLAALNHPSPRPYQKVPSPPKTSTQSFLGLAVKVLGSVLLISVLIFSWALNLSLIDSIYFVVTTATTTGYGDISLKDGPDWLKLFGCAVMLAGGGLVAVLFSHLSALVVQDRLEERMQRRASQMQSHVILAGLGRIGYRVERLLSALGIPCVVLDPQGSRFTSAAQSRSVVLRGDARIPEDLYRAGLNRARAFVGCTDNDLLNLQCCLQAKKLVSEVYTIARIQDGELAESLLEAFGLNAVINPVQVGVGAFVGAATGERALRRFRVGAHEHLAFRHRLTQGVDASRRAAWDREGVLVLAVETLDTPRVPGRLQELEPDCEIILCGSEATLKAQGLL